MDVSMTRAHEAAWHVARAACTTAVLNGNHRIAGAVVQSAARSRAVGLCVACGDTVEVDLDDPRPEPSGYAVGVRCVPRHHWWRAADSRLSSLAAAARTDPTFMAYALAAFARGKGLEDSWELSTALSIERATLYRLDLFPSIKDASAGASAGDLRASALVETARDADIALSMLTSVLAEARAVLADEAARARRAAGQPGEGEIAAARQDLAVAESAVHAARTRLESLEVRRRE